MAYSSPGKNFPALAGIRWGCPQFNHGFSSFDGLDGRRSSIPG
jgi:hypothetical protein